MDLVARSLLTYLLHSSVLLGLAWLVRLALRERRLAVQEAVLRAALVGGFVTAGLQVGLQLRPAGGALELPPPTAAVQARLENLEARPGPAAAPEASTPAAGWHARAVLAPTFVERGVGALASLRSLSWRAALGVAWSVLALLALVRLAAAALRLRWLLRDRRPIRGGRLVPEAAALAGALGLRSSVRLSTAPHLGVPLATGVLRPEVCLPPRAVAELGADEQVALCAHELAHVARHDPAWVLLVRLAAAAAPLQPLNGWARRRLQELSECLSDDLAVAASARPVGLARSLVDVASWTLGESPVVPAAAAGAFSARSRLGHRVERLMDPFRSLERPRRSLLPLASAAVLASALVMPVVSGSALAQGAPASQAAPATQVTPATPTAPVSRATKKAQAARRAEAASPDQAAKAEARRADLERELEAVGRRIGERAKLHEGEMKKLEAEIQTLAERFRPNEAELQRLGGELASAAQELASAAAENAGEGRRAEADERARAAKKRMAELREQIHSLTRDLHADESRALAEKARALADQARPTAEELAELKRLSRELARESRHDVRELGSIDREVLDSVRQGMEAARTAMHEAAEAARQAAEGARQAAEEARRAVDAARRELMETPKQHE